jgi:ketosteroid isomerase-like protein
VGQNGALVKADAQTEAAALEMLERFCSGFAARNADALIGFFAPDADIVAVSSEEALLRGPEELRGFFQRYAHGLTAYSWTWDRHDVSAAGDVAWLLAEGTEKPRGTPPPVPYDA